MKEVIQFISRYPTLSVIWVSLLVTILFSMLKHLTSKIKNITSSEVIRLINKENAIVIDLRQYNDFCIGHITGAIHLPSSKSKSNNISELEMYKDRPIIVVDDTGMQSHKFASKLIKAGFKKVYILKEGISGWNEENLPLVQNK